MAGHRVAIANPTDVTRFTRLTALLLMSAFDPLRSLAVGRTATPNSSFPRKREPRIQWLKPKVFSQITPVGIALFELRTVEEKPVLQRLRRGSVPSLFDLVGFAPFAPIRARTRAHACVEVRLLRLLPGGSKQAEQVGDRELS